MSKLISAAPVTSNATESRIAFTTEGGGNWPAWDRFLTLDGQKAYHIGNFCGTCGFFFERLQGATDKLSPLQLSKRFRAGITAVDEDLLLTIAAALPAGKYMALLLECIPKRVMPSQKGDYFCEEQAALWGTDPFWGLPHYTKTEYYRTEPVCMTDGRCLFEFVIPMFPKNYLRQKTVDEYIQASHTGTIPTALALSVLDVKQPSDWEGQPAIKTHWCLSHYLLDGHHKTFAASEHQFPIRILSFLALEKGISTFEQIREMMDIL